MITPAEMIAIRCQTGLAEYERGSAAISSLVIWRGSDIVLAEHLDVSAERNRRQGVFGLAPFPARTEPGRNRC